MAAASRWPGLLPNCCSFVLRLFGACLEEFQQLVVQGWTRHEPGRSLPFYQGGRHPTTASNYCNTISPLGAGLRLADCGAEIYREKHLMHTQHILKRREFLSFRMLQSPFTIVGTHMHGHSEYTVTASACKHHLASCMRSPSSWMDTVDPSDEKRTWTIDCSCTAGYRWCTKV